jgi:DNA (cytosine-5)-methyltransferase 1
MGDVMKTWCVGNGQLDQARLSDKVGALNCMHDQQAILREREREMNLVRRLTPLECERLQGFEDGWTDIGDWTDTKGKKHKAADSPRYKALGNSIATPFWFWLLRRISAQYERPATLGSLFDGIGGFPYCWEKCNGKGTAIWASEIEEFPIAVTKIRFPEEET